MKITRVNKLKNKIINYSPLLNESDSANSKATTIQAVESPSVGADSSETSELQVDDSAVPQEVHRQSSIQEGESLAILCSQSTTCGSKSEDPSHTLEEG